LALPHLPIEQRQKQHLRQGYSAAVRRFELASIGVYSAVMCWLLWRIAPGALASPWLAVSAFMLGYIAADLVSGIVHWAADTWGTPEWPLLGQALIRPFREHHVDPQEITRHDFVETNGNNCFISIGPGVAAALLPDGPGHTGAFFAATFTFSLILWVLFTNQFHKWSHLEAPPPAIALLQRWHLILPRDHHLVHHSAPYTRYYCITVGWLNEPLQRIAFFPFLERLVSGLTGLVPREDDIGKRAALALVEEQQAEQQAAQQQAGVRAEPLPKQPPA
jgi:ubiquitin-conjugating enzyme E2 variant